jgi:hypothetical protein
MGRWQLIGAADDLPDLTSHYARIVLICTGRPQAVFPSKLIEPIAATRCTTTDPIHHALLV